VIKSYKKFSEIVKIKIIFCFLEPRRWAATSGGHKG